MSLSTFENEYGQMRKVRNLSRLRPRGKSSCMREEDYSRSLALGKNRDDTAASARVSESVPNPPAGSQVVLSQYLTRGPLLATKTQQEGR